MLHAGLDLSRRRLDYCLLGEGSSEPVGFGAVSPDADGLAGLARVVALRHRGHDGVCAVIESMNGARFVHDTLERCGWDVQVADAARVKGFAPVACKTDRIDAWVLAELSRRDMVPAIWLPDFEQRSERQRARFRLYLVRQRTSLKNHVHAQLMAFGHACPVSDLFGARGRALLARLDFPEPWRSGVLTAVGLIDELERQISAIERDLKALGAEHRYVRRLVTVPGIAWVLGYTIAAEIGDIERFRTPTKLIGYSGLCPRVYQSGDSDRRGALTKQGPKYLRWALMEAATNAAKHPLYRQRYQHTKTRLGKQRGAKVAQVQLARTLTEAIWHMLTRDQDFAPAGAPLPLAA
ncbi:MAG: IS110 family transposase [Solirubrobacteraceae bacterium]